MPGRSKPRKRRIPFKGTPREYIIFLEDLVVDLKQRNTELEADRERITNLVPGNSQPSHQVPVEPGSKFDSLDHYFPTSNDLRPLKRPRIENDLSGTELSRNESFPTIITTPQACSLQNPHATGIVVTWNNSTVDEKVQEPRAERSRKRLQNSQTPAKVAEPRTEPSRKRLQKPSEVSADITLLGSLPISEQQWIDLRNTSNFNTPEILFDTFRALVLNDRDSNASLFNVPEEDQTPRSVCEKLLKTHQELRHRTSNRLLSCFRELIFCCICAISIEEGSSSDEVDLLMEAYWPGHRRGFSFWSRLRAAARRMARLIESLEDVIGYRGSQLFLMKSFTMEQYQSIAKPADIANIIKEMNQNLGSMRAEAEEYRLSFSPAVLIMSMGIEPETANKALGTKHNPRKMDDRHRDPQTRLQTYSEPNHCNEKGSGCVTKMVETDSRGNVTNSTRTQSMYSKHDQELQGTGCQSTITNFQNIDRSGLSSGSSTATLAMNNNPSKSRQNLDQFGSVAASPTVSNPLSTHKRDAERLPNISDEISTAGRDMEKSIAQEQQNDTTLTERKMGIQALLNEVPAAQQYTCAAQANLHTPLGKGSESHPQDGDDFPWEDFDELSMQTHTDPDYAHCFLDISIASGVAEVAKNIFFRGLKKSPLQPLFRLDENGTRVERNTPEFDRLSAHVEVNITDLPKELQSPVVDEVLENLTPKIRDFTQREAYDYQAILVELGAGLFRARDEALCSILIPIEAERSDQTQRMRFDKGQENTVLALVEWPSLVILPAGFRIRKVGYTTIFVFVTILPKGTLEKEKDCAESAR